MPLPSLFKRIQLEELCFNRVVILCYFFFRLCFCVSVVCISHCMLTYAAYRFLMFYCVQCVFMWIVIGLLFFVCDRFFLFLPLVFFLGMSICWMATLLVQNWVILDLCKPFYIIPYHSIWMWLLLWWCFHSMYIVCVGNTTSPTEDGWLFSWFAFQRHF